MAVMPCDVDPESLERSFELESSAADEFGWLSHDDQVIRFDLPAGLRDLAVSDADFAC
jgi:hypothetical protein